MAKLRRRKCPETKLTRDSFRNHKPGILDEQRTMWDFGYFQGLPDTDPKAPAIVLSNWWCVLIAFAAGTTFYLLYDQTEKVKAVRMIVLFRQHVPPAAAASSSCLNSPSICVLCVAGFRDGMFPKLN